MIDEAAPASQLRHGEGRPYRAARRPLWLSSGSILPIVLAVVAAGTCYAALADRSAVTSVVVAASAIPAGAPVDAADTKLAQVHTSDGLLYRGLLKPADVGSGWVAAVPIKAEGVVTASELARPSHAAMGEMSIAVPLQQAAGGAIVAGDLIDVITTDGSGEAHYVAQRLRVLSVAPASGATAVLGGGQGAYFVVVSVGKQAALRIAAAIGGTGTAGGQGQIELVLSNGEAATTEQSYGPAGNSAVASAGGGSGPGAGASRGPGDGAPRTRGSR